MAEPAETRDATAVYVAGILAKSPPMSRQQRDRLQVLLAHIHSARQQLRSASIDRKVPASSPAASHRVTDMRPPWWIYPAQCANSHDWKPGSVIVTWYPCADCPAAVANQMGHLRVSCRASGCASVWHGPAHAAR
jgi:hypothetical protein